MTNRGKNPSERVPAGHGSPGDAKGRQKLLPRPAGLDLIAGGKERRGCKTDADLVAEAKQDLLRRLQDPYYWEAYQEIKREPPPFLNDSVGRKKKGAKRGDVAARYQWGEKSDRKQAKRPGRPDSVRPLGDLYLKVAKIMIERGEAQSYAEVARMLAKDRNPKNPLKHGKTREQAAIKIAQVIYDARRRDLKNS